MDENFSLNKYNKALNTAVEKLEKFYNKYKKCDEEYLREQIFLEYKKHNLDPDGKAIRERDGIKCTADGMHSIYRICNMESDKSNIVSVYEKYRKYPIFFFPSEQEGINQTRAKKYVYGDRIDYTLYDLKLALEGKTDLCRLNTAYKQPKTAKWLDSFDNSFKELIDWYEIKGIFTDDSYNVLNIETGEIISEIPPQEYFSHGWTKEYYENLKEKIDAWYKEQGIGNE